MKTRTILVAALVCMLAFFTSTIVHAGDALPSWNDGSAKQPIVDFVAKITKEGSFECANGVPSTMRRHTVSILKESWNWTIQ